MPGEISVKQNRLEELAHTLEAEGTYKVLRRIAPIPLNRHLPHDQTRLGIFLDLETTGLDPQHDEIIEFGMVPFAYTLNGTILGTLPTFSRLREPNQPIPPDITTLTGITQEMVAGKTVSPDDVAQFTAQASLIVAHNARFDRLFAENFWDGFSKLPWACSMEDVPWQAEGFEGRSLGYLAMQAGWFFDGHRATDDCLAGVTLLNTRLPKTQAPALSALLREARKPRWQIWAENAPFEYKDKLKARGYRWNDGSNSHPKAWFTEVPLEQKDEELHFLKTAIGLDAAAIPTREITAWDRFSARA
ncbi:3'-5' exonuclease [Acetobacter suratthaniensis]|uniref:3'-5' exonuclease n=1 Tax=Acetobacter suratthaniensis TaxID=1502841 RepID=A0ABS3LP42_9PROT|nr:3'-5' exonuclease [Acetobacter suratthaniensis]MBO1329134.1 3'-5' exonuclease [Acetobacter suratthaniensis]